MSISTGNQTFNEDIQHLIEDVSFNCNIADAHNAQENTMCIYLLKMRDYYRWTHNLPLNATISRENLGKWINDKENSWEKLYDEEFLSLNINNQTFDPFDTDNINYALRDHSIHYSAGIGRGGQVHFHLGAEITFISDWEKGIYATSEEFARDLTATPAHSINGNIFLRKEALQHYIWSKYEEWTWKKPINAMYRAMQYYPFDTDPIKATNQMCGNEIHSTMLHEEGEITAGKLLGDEWETLLMNINHSRAEILTRASRDHLADCLVTLPTLIKENNWPSIHFYFANYEGLRKTIWPELLEIYQKSNKQNNLVILDEYISKIGLALWQKHTTALLEFAVRSTEKLHKQVSTYFETELRV